MRSYSLLVITSALTLVAFTLAGCERDAASPPEDSAKATQTAEQTDDEQTEADESDEPASKPGPAPTRPPKAPEPLVEALEAPDKAVTSQGRFKALMERGLSEYMPEIGILYGAGGVDQAGLRVAIAADGRGRWARGKGPYWSDLSDSGDFELEEDDLTRLAEVVSAAWTGEVDYKSSSVKQTRVIIIRDGETARVFEHSSVPPSLTQLEKIVVSHVPGAAK